MPNDKMSREEAERWLAELTANPERMSAKMSRRATKHPFVNRDFGKRKFQGSSRWFRRPQW